MIKHFRRATEHQIQAAFIAHCRWKANQDARYANIIAIPNAGKRSAKTARWLQLEGLSAGFPDVFVFVPSGHYHGLAMEFKVFGKEPRQNQKEWLQRLADQHYFACVVHSTDLAINTLENYLNGPG